MRIIADLHTHTLVSHHAFSTAQEMCRGARDAGLAAIGITDHGPALPDGAHPWHFGNISTLPRHLEDVFVIRGMEANILDTRGSLDTTDFNPSALDFIIASFHDPCFPPVSMRWDTPEMKISDLNMKQLSKNARSAESLWSSTSIPCPYAGAAR